MSASTTSRPAPPAAAPSAPRSRTFRQRAVRWYSTNGFWLALMLPVLLFLLAAQAAPLLETVRLGFREDVLTSGQPSRWVGTDNYVELITNDRRFWPIVRNSFIWVLGSVVLQLVLGTLAALVLNMNLRVRALWRGLLMVPWVTPVVVVALIWRWMFEGSDRGLVNHVLIQTGAVDQGIVWLSSNFWVWPVLLLASTWKGLPFVALMVLAALQAIPRDILESASVDGASSVQRFWYITLPSLRPTLFVTGMISLVTSWFKFELIWALTHGGPGFATSILPTYVYTKAFRDFDFGMAGAVATLSMVIVLVLAGGYALLLRERRHKWKAS